MRMLCFIGALVLVITSSAIMVSACADNSMVDLTNCLGPSTSGATWAGAPIRAPEAILLDLPGILPGQEIDQFTAIMAGTPFTGAPTMTAKTILGDPLIRGSTGTIVFSSLKTEIHCARSGTIGVSVASKQL